MSDLTLALLVTVGLVLLWAGVMLAIEKRLARLAREEEEELRGL